jgi:hypothetical protein
MKGDSMRAFLRRVAALSADDLARIVELQLAAQRGGRRQLEKAARVKVSRLDAEHDRVATIDAAFLDTARAVGYVGMRQVAQSAVRWAGLAEVYREQLTTEEVKALQSVFVAATTAPRVPA